MINARWGKHTYAYTTDIGDDPGGGGKVNAAAQARKEGADLVREAARKKFFFQQKMALEGKRKS